MNAPLHKIVAHIRPQDPMMADLIERQGHLSLPKPLSPFASLCRTIIGQQLSVRSASTVWERFQLQFRKAEVLKPDHLKNADEATLRQSGLSRSKAASIQALTLAFIQDQHRYTFPADDPRSDEEIAEILQRIRGIGPWTAQMFLMFTLRRPDVFASGDLGIQNAISRLYAPNGIRLTAAECLRRSEPWSPYRSIVCLHLWHSLE